MNVSARALAALCAVAAFGSPVHGAGSAVVTTEKLGWRLAEQLASDAVAACAERDYSVVATVVDVAGRQQAVIKGDTAGPHSIALSYRKAYTAYFYGKLFNKNSTSELIEAIKDPSVRATLNTMPEVAFVGGGLTIRKVDGSVLGGLGVSGAPGGDKDEACAAAAIARHKDAWK